MMLTLVVKCAFMLSVIHALDIGTNPTAILGTVNVASYDPTLSMATVVQYYCANPTTKVFSEVYYGDQNLTSKLDVSKPISFLIHGWTDTGNEPWMVEVANAWIQRNYTNVCRVGWERYSYAEYITAATQNVKLVGNYVAKFIQELHDKHGVQYGSITIAGHSLGAHVAGIVGHTLNGEIKRIIGMDPAGPLFTVPIIVSTDYRLDVSDAHEVVVIHSCDGVLGVDIASGHQDFFPDSGKFPQSGCLLFKYGIYGSQIEPITCSHIRAVRIFHNSLLDSNCIGIKCEGIFSYMFNQCGPTTAVLGPQQPIVPGKFYFRTDGKAHCTGTY